MDVSFAMVRFICGTCKFEDMVCSNWLPQGSPCPSTPYPYGLSFHRSYHPCTRLASSFNLPQENHLALSFTFLSELCDAAHHSPKSSQSKTGVVSLVVFISCASSDNLTNLQPVRSFRQFWSQPLGCLQAHVALLVLATSSLRFIAPLE